MIEKLIKELASTSKKLGKERILSYSDSILVKEVALYTFDKINKQYHVKKYNKCEIEGQRTIEQSWFEIKDLLDRLNERTISGHIAIHEVEKCRSYLNKDAQHVFDLILGRDWKAGLSGSTINKVWPDTIPEFSTALATTYEPDKHQKLLDESTHFISRKLDGVRCIAINTNGEWKFFSRAGNPFLTLGKVEEDLNRWDIKNVVLDGELCIVDDNGNEDFSSVMKVIKKKDYTIAKPKFKVFDYLKLDEFYSKESKNILSERLGNLKIELSCMDLPTVDILKQVKFTEDAFTKLIKDYTTGGWEGLMLRRDTTYKGKRSKDLLKVKQFFDDEFEVQSLEVGDFTETIKGEGTRITPNCMLRMNIVTCSGSDDVTKKHLEEYSVGLGTGMSIQQRKDWAENPDLIVGKMITVKFFEYTRNAAGKPSLRFPSLKVIHENGRDT